MSRLSEGRPPGVPDSAIQGGEARGRGPHVEPSVWTDRMLTALEHGVKGGKWFSLMDKVYSLRALRAAFTRVKANQGAAGVDHQSQVSTAGCEGVCAVSCANASNSRAAGEVETINAGPTPTLPNSGYSP